MVRFLVLVAGLAGCQTVQTDASCVADDGPVTANRPGPMTEVDAMALVPAQVDIDVVWTQSLGAGEVATFDPRQTAASIAWSRRSEGATVTNRGAGFVDGRSTERCVPGDYLLLGYDVEVSIDDHGIRSEGAVTVQVDADGFAGVLVDDALGDSSLDTDLSPEWAAISPVPNEGADEGAVDVEYRLLFDGEAGAPTWFGLGVHFERATGEGRASSLWDGTVLAE